MEGCLPPHLRIQPQIIRRWRDFRDCRVRQLLTVVTESPSFLWQCIHEAWDWLALAWADAMEVLKAGDVGVHAKLACVTTRLERVPQALHLPKGCLQAACNRQNQSYRLL